MNPTIEATGKNIESAITNALYELKVLKEDVDIKIISEGGLFKKAKVVVTVSDDALVKYKKIHNISENLNKTETNALKNEDGAKQNAINDNKLSNKIFDIEKLNIKHFDINKNEKDFKDNDFNNKKTNLAKLLVQDCLENDFEILGKEFLENLFKILKIKAEIEILKNGNDIFYEVNSDEDMKSLIGFRGETLIALQFVLSTIITRQDRSIGRIRLNINHFKEQRELSLVELAEKQAKYVMETRRTVRLEPMVSYERKIIHSALQNFCGVKTHSEGEDPNRRIIIEPTND